MLSAVRAASALGCGVAALLAAAACGSSHHPAHPAGGYAGHAPRAILADTLRATRAATAFRVAGTLTDGGRALGASLGYAAPGRLSARLTEGARVIRIVVVPAGSYLSANSAFWRQQAPHASPHRLAALANRWFRTAIATSRGFTHAFAALTPARIADCLAATFTHPTVSGTQTVDGQSAVILHTTDPRSGSRPSSLDVAIRPPHHLLRLTETATAATATTGCDGAGTGAANPSLTFSDWNAVRIIAPAGARPLP